MKRVGLLLVFAVLSLAVLLTGCQKGEGEEGKVAAKESKTVEYWCWWNEQETRAQAIQQWIDDFKEVRPEITININYIGREVLTKAMAARSGGQVIDIIDADHFVLKGALILNDQALPLDDALATKNWEGDKAWSDVFIDGTLEQYTYEGKTYLVPYVLFTNGIFYDKHFWDENGWVAPTTWDEFLSLCGDIKKSGIAPIAQDGGVDFYNDMWNYQLMARLVGPGKILEAAEDKTGESWNAPAFKKAIEMERELFDKGYFIEGCTGFTWPAGQLTLVAHESAMELCGSWIANELDPQVDADWEWGFFPFPEIAGGVGKLTDMESYPTGWAIFNDTKVADEAIEFLKFCTSVDKYKEYIEATTNPSALKEVDSAPQLNEATEALKNASALFFPHDGLPDSYPDYHKNIYLKNHNLAFTGDYSPEKYAEVMAKETVDYWKNK